MIDQAVRAPDPFVRTQDHWVIRRLAPDCSRIELDSLPRTKDELRLMSAMGWEIANIHLGSKPSIPSVFRDLRKRPSNWLFNAAEEMCNATVEDWKAWTKR